MSSSAAGEAPAARASATTAARTRGTAADTTPEQGSDPNEIVVTAIRGRSKLFLALAQDGLNQCSSLTYSKPAKRLTLRCVG